MITGGGSVKFLLIKKIILNSILAVLAWGAVEGFFSFGEQGPHSSCGA